MKQKLSITVEEDIIQRIEGCVSEGSFRNKSHVVEFALNRLLREKENVNSA
jgi:Arc/MetJ-type ribon-helix-helix transcriptional regulator